MCSNVFEGFKVLGMPFSANTAEHHLIYMKELSATDQTDDKPVGRTLLILNVPPYAIERSISKVFSVAGPVKSVKIYEKNHATRITTHGLRSAYVVYETGDNLQTALKLKSLEPLSTDEHPIRTGMAKWVNDYNKSVTGQEKIFQQASQTIENNNAAKVKKAKDKRASDGDGWTQVTAVDRRPGVARTENKANKQNEKLKRRNTGLEDFYRFQTKERNKNHITALRKSFADDMELVEKLKQTRNFKPQS